MNSVNIMGRLVADPFLRATSSGKKVCNFTIAVDSGRNNTAYFFPVVAWNGTAENIAKFFHKGSKIALSGMITQRTYQGEDEQMHNVVEILANSFDFCNDKKAAEQQAEQGQQVEAAAVPDSDDVPFKI